MLPVLQAVGAGLSALSALKNLTSSSNASKSTESAASTPAAPAASTSTKAAAPTSSELQDRFLKLLVTQMRNQDPLNPLDNAQVTTQLAQISTVGGIDKLNTSLTGLSSSLLSGQSLQASAVIGRDVIAAGSQLNLTGGKARGALELKQDADRVFVTISDSSGVLVRTLDLGAAKAGVSAFEWDGKTDAGTVARSGKYVFQPTAIRGNSTIAVDALATGRVEGVSLDNGIRLNLETGVDIGMSDVKRIL